MTRELNSHTIQHHRQAAALRASCRCRSLSHFHRAAWRCFYIYCIWSATASPFIYLKRKYTGLIKCGRLCGERGNWTSTPTPLSPHSRPTAPQMLVGGCDAAAPEQAAVCEVSSGSNRCSNKKNTLTFLCALSPHRAFICIYRNVSRRLILTGTRVRKINQS